MDVGRKSLPLSPLMSFPCLRSQLKWLIGLRNYRDFLWLRFRKRKTDHLVGWDLVCAPKRDLLSLKESPWGTKPFLESGCEGFLESNTFWHKVILNIYRLHSNGWDTKTILRWSHCCPWKVIFQVFQWFLKFHLVLGGRRQKNSPVGVYLAGQESSQVSIFKSVLSHKDEEYAYFPCLDQFSISPS